MKSATFTSEAMFYLQAIGLLPKVRLISSVSGGSFAAARYALSCDAGERGTPRCVSATGKPRPVWDYRETMPVMTGSLWPMIVNSIPAIAGSLVIPNRPTAVPPRQYASFVDENILRPPGAAGPAYVFGDLDENVRPRLALNATLVSEQRYLTDLLAGKGYLRRRNADEYFHFAFTEYFFNSIGSDFSTMPIGYGVAASGAFPALIDYVTLAYYRLCVARQLDTAACENDNKNKLVLMDGGANDNQGLIEIYALFGEIASNQARSDNSAVLGPGNSGKAVQVMRPGDKALVIALNSSITEATGLPNAASPAGALGVVTRSLAAVDVYSGTEVNVRRRLYVSSLQDLNSPPRKPEKGGRPLVAAEISLLTLDRYPDGGMEAAAVRQANIYIPPEHAQRCDGRGYDINACQILRRREPQQTAWIKLRQRTARDSLRLSNLHPQCLFEQSRLADDGLTKMISLPKPVANCLRHAARWSTALSAQELCDLDDSPLNNRSALSCGPKPAKVLTIPGIDSVLNAPLPACDFNDNDANANRGILNHLYENRTFSEEAPGVRAIDPRSIPDAELGQRLNEICDLNQLYPPANHPIAAR